ncbi:MAG TPA: S9 family peptidase [Acidimicrobiales bacterium]|jgi:dipeptidyl aminopeptidase/acylaminoacyl peptidase
MRPSDIGRLIDVAQPAVSPDGATIACVVVRVDLPANDYRSAVWLVAADGGSAPRRLTAGEHRDLHPAWSPDGGRVAFTRTVTKGPKGASVTTVHVVHVDGTGEVATLAELPETVDLLAWSPDGRRIAYSARQRSPRYEEAEDERGRRPRRIERLQSRLDDVGWTVDRPTQVFVVPADGSADPVAVTSGPFDHTGPTWSPDGRRLAIAAARHEDWDLEPAVDLFVVDVDAALAADEPPEPERVTKTWLDHSRPSWSPDGTRIACLAVDVHAYPRHTNLLVVDLESGATTEVTRSLDRTCAPYPGVRSPHWEGETIWFSIEDRGDVHVYRVAADGSSAPERVVAGERWITGYDLAAGTVGFTATTLTSPGELFSVVGGEERKLTSFADGFLAACPPLPAERFTVPSPGGGEIDAWLVRPPGLDESVEAGCPLVMTIHGGPATQYGNRYFDEVQLYASAGVAVVYCNPHGSTGFTEDWVRAIRSPEASEAPGTGWGGLDYDDLMAVVDATVERNPWIDPERLGVMGGSYGGYMTSWIVGHSDRFAAGISERAVNNLLTEEATCDIAGAFRHQFGFLHLDKPEELLRMSPISYVRDIRTPLLILHSENDLRCPIEQADQLFVALRLLGRDVEYWRFPEEGHELSRSGWPRHRVHRAELIVDWWRRRLAVG